MHISWHGQYTLKFQTGETTIIVDPYAPTTGLRPFRSQGSVVALTWPQNPEHSHVTSLSGSPTILAGPGEFALASFTLHAIPWRVDDGSQRAIQRWSAEGMCVVNLASLNRELTDNELKEIEKEDIDILLTPVGGGTALSTDQAIKAITTLEPRLVIPTHFALPGLTEKLESVKEFADNFGIKISQAEKKVIVKASKLPAEDMQIVLLMP